MCQELNVRINMVRTKLLPKPFPAPSHKKPLRLKNEPNQNTIRSDKVHFPVRVMLKAKRKFTVESGIKEFHSGALNAKEISQVNRASLPRQKYSTVKTAMEHKRCKSLHKIHVTPKVNLSCILR